MLEERTMEPLLPYPLNEDSPEDLRCGWCDAQAICMVPSWSDYRLSEVEDGSCLVGACAKHGRIIMLRVGPPREQSERWINGTQWPLCHFCGKTLDNPSFGGPSVLYSPPGKRFGTYAHQVCVDAHANNIS